MKKKIKLDFFSDSKKWPRRIPQIKKITLKTVNKMSKYFSNNYSYNINLVLTDKSKMSKLNKKYKNKDQDTDVLTFVTKILNKNLGKIVYCDIFFSINEIESFTKKNDIILYDHYAHLLIHSILHINGYDHKNSIEHDKMKTEEIKILKKFNISNPYLY